ncbi:MAG: hypothetical protein JWN03_6673 [Nocardia sp.]|uniref:hypothetical protein n=1 Tax=Nocardia sp. TaxID=1821 RepID=UPI002601AE62|nr:hypothetical protein [Nocardia sp.]MCU1646398.1 hypothetical protein [Nocardia sp.]
MTTNAFQMTPELPGWLWTLPPATLAAVLAADGDQFEQSSIQDYYWVQLREMALHLIVGAPTGPATGAADFLSRLDPYVLATLWGGSFSSAPWTGEPGVDHQIAALLDGKQPVLLSLRAEFTNRFRRWAAFPAQLRAAVLAADPAASFTTASDPVIGAGE